MNYRILHGEVIQMLQALPDASVDAVVTDPPYELGFMGKGWDSRGVAYNPAMWAEVLRVLKPGGHLLAFGGTRTYHRMTCAVEDGGFQIRDQIGWLFGSGFPKSHNLHGEWEGWGTALKPAWEPICVARKWFGRTVLANVSEHGTGAINIAGCRVQTTDILTGSGSPPLKYGGNNSRPFHDSAIPLGCNQHDLGRWPANVIHDGSDQVLAEFEKYGDRLSSCHVKKSETDNPRSVAYGDRKSTWAEPGLNTYSDSGSAARFFYCAKASREDRNEGCEEFEKKPLIWSSGTESPGTFQAEGTDRTSRNNHPTVKPTDLMRYLCRLVTPPGGTVLDCFMGSGSTGKAALYEGFSFIGIDEDVSYCAIAKARMEFVLATDSPLLRNVEVSA